MQWENEVQHVFLVGAKSLGAYGGYETFVYKLTEYHQNKKNIKYHVACKANGDGCMDETKVDGVTRINDHEFEFHNAHCFKIDIPQIGPAQAIYYDVAALKACCKYIKEHRIKHPIVYIMACRIGPFADHFYKEIHKLGGTVYLNPDGLLGVWGKWMKHAKYIYNIQDFNPEQVLAVGYTKSKLITDAMMWFDKFSCKRSDLVITVGRDLVETVENRFKDKKVPKTVMINNWIDENEIYPLDESNEKVLAFKKKYGLGGKFVIMYSGNIGLYYDLENLIKVVEKIKPGTKTADGREVVFAFVGAGSVLDKLVLYVKQHHMDNVTFIPYQDKADLIYSLNAGDVHWCVNAKGIKGVSCPSKAYGIMAASKPILGVLESGSEVRCLIEDTHGGLCCEPGEYDKVEKNIRWFIENSLKKMVESLGHKVVFVDYKTNVLIEDRNDKTKKQELLYQEIKDGIKFHILKKYGEQQEKFIECYPILGISKFKAYHTKVDVLIVGSDEVFNCTQRNPKVGFALDFFGENNKARRLITYAASFGSTTYEKLCSYKVDAQIKKDLKMFDAIFGKMLRLEK